MPPPSPGAFRPSSIQEFVDEAIDDPAVLQTLDKRRRRPVRWPVWLWWVLGVAATATLLGAGMLLGHYLL